MDGLPVKLSPDGSAGRRAAGGQHRSPRRGPQSPGGRRRDGPVPAPRVLLLRPESAAAPATPAPAAPAAAAREAARPAPRPAKPAARSLAGRHEVVSAAGRLVGDPVRQELGRLRCRVCVGVLGRESAGKSLLIAQLQGQWAAPGPPPGPAAGIGVWVTGASTVLVDAPPVLGDACDPKWAPPHAPRRATAARIRDLQVALLLLRVCDALVLVADGAGGVDLELARLLAAAAGLAAAIPGLALGAAPACRLHIAVVPPRAGPSAALDCAAIARAYEAAAGLPVAGVSVVPRQWVPADPPPFLAIADCWADPRPLYAVRGRAKTAVLPPSTLAAARRPCAPGFDRCVHDLRARLLGPSARGANPDWAALFVRAWDSIRRSDRLLSLAASAASWPPHTP